MATFTNMREVVWGTYQLLEWFFWYAEAKGREDCGASPAPRGRRALVKDGQSDLDSKSLLPF